MKKFLLATAAILASTSAYAADYDVAHPFYTPAKGKFVSTTSLDYEHMSIKQKDADWKYHDAETTLTEGIEYGVTNDLQVGLTLARTWGKGKWKNNFDYTTDREYTNAWGVSAGYNIINDGKAFLNVGLQYSQLVERDGDAMNDDDEHGKYIDLTVFGGYNFDAVTVFGSINYNRQIDGEKEVLDWWGRNMNEKSKEYTLEAGAYKAFNNQFSARTSLSVDIDETKYDEERTYWWNVGADYSISKKMAVGMNASYMLDNDVDELGENGAHRAYKLGVDFTVEF